MTLKNLLLVWFLFNLVYGSDCLNNFIEIDGECYFKQHLDVLQDFIDINKNLKNTDILDWGHQEWTDGRLTYLYLGSQNITTIPESIGLLKDLISLDLRNNNISTIPEGICSIYPYYSQLNFSNNRICPPYPYCFDYISHQNTSECEELICKKDYYNIDGKCYYKQHINILQTLIDSNLSLKGIAPLQIGNEIGYQKWKDGKLTHLNLVNNDLTKLPESICYIYKDLDAFDVSNNFICPPYPKCFEFIGFQNTNVCTYLEIDSENIITNQQPIMSVQSDTVNYQNDILNINTSNTNIWEISCSNGYVKYSNNCYLQLHIDILQDFIDHNISLENMEPLEIGDQKWSNNKLISLNLSNLHINTIPDSIGLFKDLKSLDLSDNNLTSIPDGLCNIYPDYSSVGLSNNKICPPYPFCFDHISHQNTSDCEQKLCPDNYKKINGECIHSEHFNFLESLVDSNKALSDIFVNLDISEFYNKIGYQIWENGKIETLIIKDSNLITIPENICSIYYDIATFDISNNFICPPYPTCFNNAENQNLENCAITLMPQFSCPDGCVSYYNSCYYYDDLEVMNDLIKINEVLINFHPLSLGNQLWENNRIIQLNFSGMGITNIPESIYKLNNLKRLNLSNNNLNALPENFCLLYPQLENFEIINNNICPPYIECFDFISDQNTDNCEKSFCPFGYLDIEGECYFEKDVSILNDFIAQNKSLVGRQPLEIGIQKWKNMRLYYLYLGVNELTAVPESICEILPELKNFNIAQNKICPPYPDCVEKYLGEQVAGECP